MVEDELERNKRAVMQFYDLMFNQCKPAEAIATYAGDNYTSTTLRSQTENRLS